MKIKAVIISIGVFFNASGIASLNSQKINYTIGSAIENKMLQRGFSINDPRYQNTLKSVTARTTTIAANANSYKLASSFGRSWLSVGLRGALFSRGALIYLAASGAVMWMFDGDENITVRTLDISSEQGVFGYYWSIGATDYATVSTGAISVCSAYQYCKVYSVERYYSEPNRDDLRTIYFYTDENKTKLWTSMNATFKKCDSSSVSIATCKPDYVPVPGTEVLKKMPVQDAIDLVGQSVLSEALSPDILADLANNLWRSAASQSGYAGLPFDGSNPISSNEIINIKNNKPSVGDLFQPEADFNGSINPDISPPVKPVNPSTGDQVNLGDDPAIGTPELPEPPTSFEILQPILGLMPFAKTLDIPVKTGECPKPEMVIFNETYTLDSHCFLLDANKIIIGLICSITYSLISLRIILTA
ncbi:TPA: hypothetical protein ACN1XC_004488 [Yersinia enterocolitica]|nr:hypothetical protein [Yersinia enterocolitica]HDL8463690.1 hypothetical protein [Yersinia enterocolitica]